MVLHTLCFSVCPCVCVVGAPCPDSSRQLLCRKSVQVILLIVYEYFSPFCRNTWRRSDQLHTTQFGLELFAKCCCPCIMPLLRFIVAFIFPASVAGRAFPSAQRSCSSFVGGSRGALAVRRRRVSAGESASREGHRRGQDQNNIIWS